MNNSQYGRDASDHYEADELVSNLCLIEPANHYTDAESRFGLNDYLPDKLEVELKFSMDVDPSEESQDLKNSVRKKLRHIKRLPMSLGRIRFREKPHRFARKPFKFHENQYIHANWSCSNAHIRQKISLTVTLIMSGTRACRFLYFPEYFEKSGPYNQLNFIPILNSGDYQQYRIKVLSELDCKIDGLVDFLRPFGFVCEHRKLKYLEIAYDLPTHDPEHLFADLMANIYALSRDATRKEHKDGYEQFFGKIDPYCEATCYRKMKDRVRLEIRVSDKMESTSPLAQSFILNNFRLVDTVPSVAQIYWDMRVKDFAPIRDSCKNQSLEVNGKFIRIFSRMLSSSQVVELANMVDDSHQLKFNPESSRQKSLRRRMRGLGLIRPVGWGIYKFMPYDEIERISLKVDSAKKHVLNAKLLSPNVSQ
jgi:hypothetical protein